MDSGNSGSMQSSSGGDDEYDSRSETISTFLNPSLGFGSISNHPQPPPPPPPPLSHHQSHPHTLFDPQAQNLGGFSHSPGNPNANSLYNLDLVWSRSGLRSEPMNYTDLGNFTGLSSLSSSSQSLIGLSGPSQGPFPSSSAMPLPSVDGNNGGRATPRSDQSQAVVAKNSRKRTRASRRAPTTVLTTDTSNFRQRVQEFTGIPAPPFSASPYSRRFDLFGAGSGPRSGHLETLGPLYPFRPSIQKVPPSPFVSSSSSPSLLNSAMVSPTGNIANTSNNTISTSIAGLNSFSQTMVNMQNPILTFQQFQGNSAIPNSLDHELGLTHKHLNANVTAFPSHGSSDNLSRWRGEEASNGGGQENLGSFDGNNGENVNGYKLNCSASRNEGTVDSWICPSD